LIAPKTGNCNDYAVTKRHELLSRGWPSRALLLAEVIVPSGERHLVVVVRVKQGDFVIDNRNADIRPLEQDRVSLGAHSDAKQSGCLGDGRQGERLTGTRSAWQERTRPCGPTAPGQSTETTRSLGAARSGGRRLQGSRPAGPTILLRAAQELHPLVDKGPPSSAR
jgi:hypothetical protein